MKATLTELRRDTTKVVRKALTGQEVTITQHGEPRLRIVPAGAPDRAQALEDLIAIGPVKFMPRK